MVNDNILRGDNKAVGLSSVAALTHIQLIMEGRRVTTALGLSSAVVLDMFATLVIRIIESFRCLPDQLDWSIVSIGWGNIHCCFC